MLGNKSFQATAPLYENDFLQKLVSVHVDMIKCALHQVLRLPNYILNQDYFIFRNNCDYFLTVTVFILTPHPVNFPCGRKPEHPEKTDLFI
jgi:hypothetical protein